MNGKSIESQKEQTVNRIRAKAIARSWPVENMNKAELIVRMIDAGRAGDLLLLLEGESAYTRALQKKMIS